MNSLDLAFLPRFFLRVEAPSDLVPSWPTATVQEGLRLGAKLCLTKAAATTLSEISAEHRPIEASEPALGSYRVAQATPLTVECAIGDDNQSRAVDTAIRLCMLQWVWARGGLLLHAVGLARDGRAIIGLAPSGGGKSTLTDLASGFESLSDETVAILPGSGAGPEIWSTPFRSSAAKHPVEAICGLDGVLLLEKSASPANRPAAGITLVRTLVEQAYTAPPQIGAPRDLLHRAARVATSTPAFHFRFPKGKAAATLLEDLFASVGKRSQSDPRAAKET